MGKKEEGFTLLEMLIVVGLVATLVFASMPTYISQMNKTRQATDESNLHTAYEEALYRMMSSNTDETVWVELKTNTSGGNAKFEIIGNLSDSSGDQYVHDSEGVFLKPGSNEQYIKITVFSGINGSRGNYCTVEYDPQTSMGFESGTNAA